MPKIVTTASGILSSSITADQIKIINVIKDGEGHFSEDTANNISFASHVEEASVEHQVQPESTGKERPSECDDSVSAKHNDDSQVSVDLPIGKLDAATRPKEDKSNRIDTDPDHSFVNSAKFDDKSIQREEGDSHTMISSSGNEETQVSATTSELEVFNHQEEIPLLDSANTGLEDPTEDSAKSEDNSAKTEENKSSVIKSTSTLETAQMSAEPSAHHAIIRQEITSPLKPLPATGPPIELCEAYNNLFLIFYSKPPIISTTSISVALKQCEDLISVAKPLRSLSVIRPYLGNAIGRFGKQLYLAIVAEPFRWLEVSMILESAVIFKEALIHIVGKYVSGPDGQINLPSVIPQFVRDLIIFKVRYLDQQRMNVNSKTVTFSFVDTSIFATWLVVQIWRDWFCREMAGVHLNPIKTGALYRTLARSGDAYLAPATVKAVIEKIRDPIKVDIEDLMEDLTLLKKFAQEAVKESCVNNSMVDVQEAGIEHLTCTRILDEELPWFETEK
jgi:hypothetical protein